MRNKAGYRFELPVNYVAARKGRLIASGTAIILCSILQGCAGDGGWPVLSKISDIENVLSPDERQKAVQDLQKDDQNHNGAAAKPVPKSGQ